jgi:Ca2+-binding EF-hand superfamily protein
MNALKKNRQKLNDYFETSSAFDEYAWKTNKISLEQIDEEEETLNQTSNSIRVERRVSTKIDPITTHTQETAYSSDIQYSIFLSKLQKTNKVYEYFIAQAIEMNILKKLKFEISKHNKNLKSEKNFKKKKNKQDADSDLESSDEELPSIIIPSKSSRGGVMYKNTFLFSNIKPGIKIADENSSKDSSSLSAGTAGNRYKRLSNKKPGLLDENPKPKEIFNEITNKKSRMTPEDFKKFLMKRYPEPVADTITSYFNFRIIAYEEYIIEMTKFISYSEIKHLEFCFNLFDFNKDKLICQKDAYTALEIRSDSYYDSDVALIIEMFNLKKSGKVLLQNRARRRSTLGLMRDKKKMRAKEIEFSLNARNKSSDLPVSIKFEEFCMIKFDYRPQIFLDFLIYACGFDFIKEKGYYSIPAHSKNNSETIVIQMNIDPDFHELVRKNEKYEYYCSLDTAMSLFEKSTLDDLLQKFKFLKSDQTFKIKVITERSMVAKLVLDI